MCFQGLCNDRKALEIGEVLSKNHIYIVGGQENWEVENSKVCVLGYACYGRPRQCTKGTCKRGEGGVGFLVSELLMADVTIIKHVNCNETISLA